MNETEEERKKNRSYGWKKVIIPANGIYRPNERSRSKKKLF
jgi:outer membrane receptor for monomeric catechols